MMPPPPEFVYVCPVDASERSLEPGTCTRDGERFELVPRVPDLAEYRMDVTASPARIVAGQPARLRFEVRDPWEGRLVDRFTVVHAKPFHFFAVSPDLEFFLHDHPRRRRGGFELDVVFPEPGLYRLLADFVPEAATPQLLTRSVFVYEAAPGAARTRNARNDEAQAGNLAISLEPSSAPATAGTATTLRFHLEPADGLEPYVGAVGHLFAASEDLIDLLHSHPMTMAVGPVVDFPVVFRRPGRYRVWVQFQREGVVNTARFDVDVAAAPPAPPAEP